MRSVLDSLGKEKDIKALISTLDALRSSLTQCTVNSEELNLKSNNTPCIPECNYPHDTIPASTYRGKVGLIQEPDLEKTEKQRARAK